jgi:WG containing repeat
MKSDEIVKYQHDLIKQVGNAISVTNKLLAFAEPQLIPYRKKDKWGFCTVDKKIVIDCIYDNLLPFSEGLSVVVLKRNTWQFGFINTSGVEVIKINYEEVDSFKEGLAKVRLNGKYGFIDRQGNIVVPMIYDTVLNFMEGLSCVKINRQYEFINKKGEIISLLKYDEVFWNYQGCFLFEDRVRVKIKNKWGFIDKKAREIIPCIYSNASSFRNGFTEVEKDGNRLFIDKNGNEINYIPDKLDYNSLKEKKLFIVEKNRKKGFCDKMGKEIIPCIYDSAQDFSNGIAKIMLNNEYGYINEKGTEYWED